MLRLLLASLFLLMTAPAWATTVTFDSAFEKGYTPTISSPQSFVSTAGTNCVPTPCSTGGVVGANTNRALLIIVSFKATTAFIPSAVSATWNGVSANAINSYTVAVTSGKSHGIWLLVLPNPASGAQTLAASWTAAGSQDSVEIGAVSLYNVNQSTPWQNFTTNSDLTATSTAPTITITTAAGNLAVGAFTDDNASSFTQAAGTTLDWKELSLDGNFESVHKASTTTSTVVNATLGSAKDWSVAGVDIVASSASGGGGGGGIGTTYYVAPTPTGSDSNNGTSGAPFATIQKCVITMSAGDTCTVADGTYTDTDNNGIVVEPTSAKGARNGTAAAPITLMSTNRGGAHIVAPGITSSNIGILVQRNYWIIDGFDISGGTGNSTSTSNHGVYASTGSDGLVLRHNTIHDIGRVCSATTNGFTGFFMDAGNTILIDSNVFHDIGRYRFTPSENGCTLSAAGGGHQANDHGLYLHGGSNVTVTHNLFYNVTMGWQIQFFGGTMTNTKVYKNTFSGGAAILSDPNINPTGQIVLGGIITTVDFKDNIHYNPTTSIFRVASSTCTAMTYDYNLTDNADANMFVDAQLACATDGGHNLKSTSPGFVSAGTNDYRLATGSAAIAAGTTVSGISCNGTCDIGAYETFGFAGAGITAATLDVTLGMSVNTPVLPATGQTTWTVACSGSNCGTPVVASAAKLTGTDSVVRLTLTGLGGSAVCEAGQTWTVTYAVGTVTDSALVGTLNQRLNAFTTQPVVNNCAGAATTGTLSQKTHQFTQAVTPGTALSAVGAANTNIRRGTSFAVVTQTDCTTHACDQPIGEKLYYRRNAGAYAPIPDVMDSDQIAYLGDTNDPSYLSGPVSCCLTGALTANTGGTQFTAAAIPVFTLTQDASIVQRRQLRLGTNALLSDTYEFLEYNQTGVVLPGGSTPAAGAKITVTPDATISAPTSLAAVGAASNTLLDLVWAPVTDVALAGYYVYVSSTSGSYGTPVQVITAASAAAAHTTMTQYRTVLSAGTWYFIVKAFDSGGQLSAASNEVTVVRTGFTAPAVRVP